MIITETKSSYRLLKQKVSEVKESIAVGGKTPTGSGGSSSVKNVSTNNNSIAEAIVKKEERNQEDSIEYGYIHKVYPQTEKVFVKVRKKDLSEYGEPLFFNWHIYTNSSLEVAMLLPLINFDPTTGESLDNLIDKKVKCTKTAEGIFTKAELVFAEEGESLLKGVVSPVDFYYASIHPDGVETALKNMGYTQESIDKWAKIGRTETEESIIDILNEKGVVRIQGEGYWDQVREEDTERTERFEKAIEEWTDRNFSQMKTRLCHIPIIAFSAR